MRSVKQECSTISILISVHSVSSHPFEFVLPRNLGKTGLHENAILLFCVLGIEKQPLFKQRTHIIKKIKLVLNITCT